MSIVIGCDSFLSLRNVRNGDLGSQLRGDRVIVLVDPNQYEGSLAACPSGVELGKLLEFNANNEPGLKRLLESAYYTRKSYYDPSTFRPKLRASSYRNNPKPSLRQLASVAKTHYSVAIHWTAGRIGLAPRRRESFGQALRSHPVVQEYKSLLREWETSAVIGFSPEGAREMALLEAANDLGIPTAVMIRSRDNLSAKIQHLPDADVYFVWSEVTRQFLLYMYPEVPAERVKVTGSPQFDRHLDSTCRLDRESFFALIGLDPSRPLVVYTMATPGLIDHEIDIAQHLADAAHGGRFLEGAQLLVRGHPRMFGSNIRLLHKEYPEALAYPPPTDVPYKSPKHEAEVVRFILEDEPVHLATLAYQDVQVNVCGTMTIDSAILDKPTVNVYYDLAQRIPAGLSLRRFYKRSDVKQMMAYEASRLARNPEECVRLINAYLEDPTIDSRGRRRAREEDCGVVDGSAGLRIADAIKEMAFEERTCPCRGHHSFGGCQGIRGEDLKHVRPTSTPDERANDLGTKPIVAAAETHPGSRRPSSQFLINKFLSDNGTVVRPLTTSNSREQGLDMPFSVAVARNFDAVRCQSLDEQYLEFVAKTHQVFAMYPQLEPMRQVIFKELLARQRRVGFVGYLKHCFRPLVRTERSDSAGAEASALVWIESGREVIVDALIPVYHELASRGVKAKLVSCGGPSNMSAPALRFRAPARSRIPVWAKETWPLLCREIRKLDSPQLERSFYCSAANTQALLDEINRILNEVKPDVVVAASTQLEGGAALMVAARALNIRSVLLQHGVLQPFYAPVLADHMLTWGESSDQILTGLGVSSKRIVAVGSPRHDSLTASAAPQARRVLLSDLRLPDKPTFVFFSNGNDLVRNGDAPIECSRWLESTAAQLAPKLNIVIRLHPNEDGSIYRDCQHLHVTKELPDLATTLAGCDWVGSLCSTVLYDALLFRKPVWQFYADGWPQLAENWKQGLAVRISSDSELVEMARRQLREDSARSANDDLSTRVFANQGRSARAVADFISSPL
jgi:hypothetical protein